MEKKVGTPRSAELKCSGSWDWNQQPLCYCRDTKANKHEDENFFFMVCCATVGPRSWLDSDLPLFPERTLAHLRTLAHTGKRAINCPLINIQGVSSMCECWPTTAVFTHIHLVSLSFTLPPLLPLDATHFLLTLFWTWFRILLHSLHPPCPQEN